MDIVVATRPRTIHYICKQQCCSPLPTFYVRVSCEHLAFYQTTGSWLFARGLDNNSRYQAANVKPNVPRSDCSCRYKGV
jgi:hypothetical protein